MQAGGHRSLHLTSVRFILDLSTPNRHPTPPEAYRALFYLTPLAPKLLMFIQDRRPGLILFALVSCLLLTGFAGMIMLDGLQYRAIKVSSDRDIDDEFNTRANEGWYPRFVMKYEADPRLIFERPRDEAERDYGLEYRADVIGSAKEIDDTFNDRAPQGWQPRFVFRSGAVNQNWRIIFERDPDNMMTTLEYRAVIIGEGREVDDTFNQFSADGWYPLFVVENNGEHRMLFARNPDQRERAWQFMAKVTRNIKEVDDLFDTHAAEGWEPIFVFQDETERWRSLFKRPVGVEQGTHEFQARRIEDISQIDDKFNQYAADGWYPMFVIPDVTEVAEQVDDEETEWVEETRWRMLFGRTLDN